LRWCRRREFTATGTSLCWCERPLRGYFRSDLERPEMADCRRWRDSTERPLNYAQRP